MGSSGDENDAGGRPNVPEDGGAGPEVDHLIAEFAEPLAAYLRRRAPRAILQEESATDLAQSVCREALRSLRRGALTFKGEGQLRQWLYGAADLKLLNRIRRRAAQKRGKETPEGLSQFPFDDPTPSAEAAHREQSLALMDSVAELDDRTQAAIRAFYFEGKSHGTVARELGVTESHSRTIVARGLARLARIVRTRLGE